VPPALLWTQPLVHAFLLDCRDNDAYKATVKNKLRNWIQV